MLRFLALMLMLVIVFFQIQTYQYPHLRYNSWSDRLSHPFDTRLRFQIAQVDTGFNITQDEVIRVAEEAIAIWHNAQPQTSWLVYDPNAKLKIRLIYDQRQHDYVSLKKIEQKLQKDEQHHQRRADDISAQRQDLVQQQQILLQQKTQIEDQYVQLKSQIEHSTSVQLKQQGLMQLDLLQQRSVVLQQQFDQLQQRIEQFNRQIATFQNDIDQHHSNIVAARDRFPPREFHKGLFDGREIQIYQFETTDDLRLTIAHELGHALGLGHHQDPEGLMYPQLEQQRFENFQLRASDLALFESRYQYSKIDQKP